MYRKKDRRQPEFEDFYLPFGGKLRSDNRWVKLSRLMPWAEIEERYAGLFDEWTGAPALSARITVGSLIIKEKLRLTDEETVEQIRENPYLQFFLGYEAYRDEEPFDPSMMVHFRRRLGEHGMSEINDLVLGRHRVQSEASNPSDDREPPADSPGGGGSGTGGETGGGNRGKQLRYLRRNLGYIEEFAKQGRLRMLDQRWYRILLVVSEVYPQQLELYEQNTRSIPGRIVSISQPHVRPIVRGKAGRPVEFGAKISIARVDGYVYLDRLSWEPYHEAGDLAGYFEAYRRRNGRYPESVHADQIYRTRANRRLCKQLGVRLSGPPLGRPKQEDRGEARRQQLIDEQAHIAVEGSLGHGKRRFSLARVTAKRADTAEASIATAALVMNLETLLERFLHLLFAPLSWPLADGVLLVEAPLLSA